MDKIIKELNDCPSGAFLLWFRGQISCVEDGIKPAYPLEYFLESWYNHHKFKLERESSGTPIFLGLGAGLPKTNREVCETLLKLGQVTIREYHGLAPRKFN